MFRRCGSGWRRFAGRNHHERSASKLELKKGTHATAVIKASDVLLGTGLDKAKISARNVLTGKVQKVETGAVNSEVILGLNGGTKLVAVITKASVEHLSLKAGGEAIAIVKASHVMIAVE